MEGNTLQENQELEYKNPDEDQGGIRRRLRDRDLLRKRKAEAEAKETNQWVFGEETQRKKQRAENKSGSKRRGRPRKSEPMQELSTSQEEVTVPQVASIALPEPTEVIPVQTSGSLETESTSVLAAPAPPQLFGSLQNPVFAPTLISPAARYPIPDLISAAGPSLSSTKSLDMVQVPVQELAPVLAVAPDAIPVPAPDQDPVQDPSPAPIETPVPPAAPEPQSVPVPGENPYAATLGKEALNSVIIEDLGPDEEEEIALSQENSVPTLSLQPSPPKYLPGNSA